MPGNADKHAPVLSILCLPAGVVPASVAMMAPRIVASRGGHGTISPAPSGAVGTWKLPSGPDGHGVSRVPRSAPVGGFGVPGLRALDHGQAKTCMLWTAGYTTTSERYRMC